MPSRQIRKFLPAPLLPMKACLHYIFDLRSMAASIPTELWQKRSPRKLCRSIVATAGFVFYPGSFPEPIYDVYDILPIDFRSLRQIVLYSMYSVGVVPSHLSFNTLDVSMGGLETACFGGIRVNFSLSLFLSRSSMIRKTKKPVIQVSLTALFRVCPWLI